MCSRTMRDARCYSHLAGCTWLFAPRGMHTVICTLRDAHGYSHLARCMWLFVFLLLKTDQLLKFMGKCVSYMVIVCLYRWYSNGVNSEILKLIYFDSAPHHPSSFIHSQLGVFSVDEMWMECELWITYRHVLSPLVGNVHLAPGIK